MACIVCRMGVEGIQHVLNEALGDDAGLRQEKWLEVVHGDKRYKVRVWWDLHAACEQLPPDTQLDVGTRLVVSS